MLKPREGGRLPLALIGAENPVPVCYTLPVASAQVKSAILLAGLNIAGETSVIEPNATRDHSENMLEMMGFALNRETVDGGTKLTIRGHVQPPPAALSLTIAGDPSSAAFLVVAALITEGSSIVIPNVCINPLRSGLFETLREMGAAIEYRNERSECGERVADIAVQSSRLKAVTVPASRAPSMIDEYPILAVAAACAEGETVMQGLAELRVKESDRLAAIHAALTACKVKTHIDGDTLHVTGSARPKGGGSVVTHFDHRIAMSFLVLGMAAEQPIQIDDGRAIATSFPNFVKLMNRLGGRIESSTAQPRMPLLIAIDGPAASGKGTLARRVAEHFELAYLDTGSLYRAVGLKLAYANQDAHDKSAALEAARSIDLEDLANPRLRQEHVGKAASIISAMPEVRAVLLDFQRSFGRSGKGAVLDGRDVGTVVFPNALFKFYLTATMEARARRRHRELSGQGVEVVFESVMEDLNERDVRDAQRDVAPLKPADDAVVIDTSTMDANSVFEKVKRMISLHLSSANAA